MNPLVTHFNFHQQVHHLPDHPALKPFIDLLENPGCFILECSVKQTATALAASRLRAGFLQDRIRDKFQIMNRFIARLAVDRTILIDDSVLRPFCNQGAAGKLIVMGIGLDLKPQLADSKIKCYFIEDGIPELRSRILAHRCNTELPVALNHFIRDRALLAAVDLYFDGSSSLEIYPFFKPAQLQDLQSAGLIADHPMLNRLVSETEKFNISFEPNGIRVLHFHPADIDRFERILSHRNISRLLATVKMCRWYLSRHGIPADVNVTLALLEREILAGDIQTTGLYYRTMDRRKASRSAAACNAAPVRAIGPPPHDSVQSA